MPIKMYKCSYCQDFESLNEAEVIEHEKEHVKQIECIKIQQKEEVPCVLDLIEEDDKYKLTFVWTPSPETRSMSSTYLVYKDSLLKAVSIKD